MGLRVIWKKTEAGFLFVCISFLCCIYLFSFLMFFFPKTKVGSVSREWEVCKRRYLEVILDVQIIAFFWEK